MSYLSDCLFIVAFALGTTLFAEGLSWLFVYRKPSYQRLKERIERLSRQLEKKKDMIVAVDKQKKHKREVNRLDDELKDCNRNMASMKMLSLFLVGFSMIAILGVLNSSWEGHVVAKIPFEPLAMFQRLSHRGLSGDDPTDCSVMFIYVLCSMGIRPNIQKLLGFAPPKAAGGSLFTPPDEDRMR